MGARLRRWVPRLLVASLLVAGGALRGGALDSTGFGLAEWERVEPALGTPGAPPLLAPHCEPPVLRLLIRGTVSLGAPTRSPAADHRWVRLPGAVLGLLAIPFVYLLGWRLSGGRVLPGLLAASAWSLAPVGVGTAAVAGPASGLALATAWILHGVLWLEESPSARGRQINLLLALLVGAGIHLMAAWLAFLAGVWFLVRVWPLGGRAWLRLWPWLPSGVAWLAWIIWTVWTLDPGAAGGAPAVALGGQVADTLAGVFTGPLGAVGLLRWPEGVAFRVPILVSSVLLLGGGMVALLRGGSAPSRSLLGTVLGGMVGVALLWATFFPGSRLGVGRWLGTDLAVSLAPVLFVGLVQLVLVAVEALRGLLRQQLRRRAELPGNTSALGLVAVLALVVGAVFAVVTWPAAGAMVEGSRRLRSGDPRGLQVERYRELAAWLEGSRRPESVVLIHAGARSQKVTRLLRYYGLENPFRTVRDPDLEGWWSDRGPVGRLARDRTHVIIALARLSPKRLARLAAGVRQWFAHPVGHAYLEGMHGTVFGAIFEVGCQPPKKKPARPSSP